MPRPPSRSPGAPAPKDNVETGHGWRIHGTQRYGQLNRSSGSRPPRAGSRSARVTAAKAGNAHRRTPAIVSARDPRAPAAPLTKSGNATPNASASGGRWPQGAARCQRSGATWSVHPAGLDPSCTVAGLPDARHRGPGWREDPSVVPRERPAHRGSALPGAKSCPPPDKTGSSRSGWRWAGVPLRPTDRHRCGGSCRRAEAHLGASSPDRHAVTVPRHGPVRPTTRRGCIVIDSPKGPRPPPTSPRTSRRSLAGAPGPTTSRLLRFRTLCARC